MCNNSCFDVHLYLFYDGNPFPQDTKAACIHPSAPSRGLRLCCVAQCLHYAIYIRAIGQ